MLTATRSRGRPAAARRSDVLDVARRRFRAGERIDLRAIAGELGLARATLYRWFGARPALIGEVLVGEFELVVGTASAGAPGRGARRLIEVLDAVNHALASAPALRRFLELEREGLWLLTSSAGPIQPRVVEVLAALIESEVRAGDYHPAIAPDTLAYAIARVGEAFIYNDAVAGIRGDVDRLREVEAALLGLAPGATGSTGPLYPGDQARPSALWVSADGSGAPTA